LATTGSIGTVTAVIPSADAYELVAPRAAAGSCRAGKDAPRMGRQVWAGVVGLSATYTMSCVVADGTSAAPGVLPHQVSWAVRLSDLRTVLTRSIFEYAIVPGLFVVLSCAVGALWLGQQVAARTALR